jgi:ActR/RegA family two-component response regulator
VDDDPAVLRATTRVLATRFDVTMAIGGPAALDAVRQAALPFAAVVSDLRMPELSGIGLLQCVRQHAPHTSRVLLTGNADVPSAVDAVNAGEIFRFLTKPCPPEALIEAITAACAQHARSVEAGSWPQVDRQQPLAAESPVADVASADGETGGGTTQPIEDRGRAPRAPGGVASGGAMRDSVLLDSSPAARLDGYVSVLRSVFAMVRPMASDCANRIERRVTQVLQVVHLGIAEHVAAAASLSQLGSIGVPADVAERIYGGWALSADDRACAGGIRPRSAELVSTSADLALVRRILSPESLPALELSDGSTGRVTEECELGARILDIACMLDDAERRGGEGAVLRHLMELERNPGKHVGILVEAFRAALRAPTHDRVRTMRLRDALPSMVLAADVVGPNGLLVARRGQRIGDMLAMRASHSWSSAVLEQSVEVVEEPLGDATPEGLE